MGLGSVKKSKCYFSGAPAQQQTDFQTDNVIVESEACGTYILTESIAEVVKEFQNKKVLSQGLINCAEHSLKLSQQRVCPVWTPKDNSEELKRRFEKNDPHNTKRRVVVSFEDFFNEPVDHSQKPFNLLRLFAHKLERSQAYAPFKTSLEDQILARIVDASEMVTILDFLEERGLILSNLNNADKFGEEVDPPYLGDDITNLYGSYLKITVYGWEFVRDQIEKSHGNSVFIATAFSWAEQDDLRVETIETIRRVCANLGYEANIVSQAHTDNITDRILSEIKRAQFVIAELTYHNRGVYFESGFAMGLGIPVIWTCRADCVKELHFDTRQYNHIEWNDDSDLYEKLITRIEATIPGRVRKKPLKP